MASNVPPPPPTGPPPPPPTSQPPPPPTPPSSRRPLPPIGGGSSPTRFVAWTIGVAAVTAIVVIGIVALAGRGGNGGGDGGGKQTPTAEATADESSGAEAALESYVREKLTLEYAGDCSATILPKGEGRVCSAFKGERQGRRAYVVGPSSYEFNLWLFLRNDGGQWQVYATQPVKADTAELPGAPWPLERGAKVIVAGTGSCLNVRVAAGTNEAAVDCVADGTEVTLAEGPVEADGFQWWRLEDRSGWVAGDYLRYPEAGATGTPTPVPVTPTPGQ